MISFYLKVGEEPLWAFCLHRIKNVRVETETRRPSGSTAGAPQGTHPHFRDFKNEFKKMIRNNGKEI